jgi:NitT/TauT family transport system permease protein
MSSPTGVFQALQTEIQRGVIWRQFAYSLAEFFFGLLFAAVIGIVVGFIAGWWRRAFFLLDPWITIMYSTPLVALVPLIILILGIGFWSKVFVVFLIAVFPVLVNTLIGVQTTGRWLLDVSRSFGASQPKQWTSVVLPGSLPFILTGLRLAGGHAMVGVVVAELIAGNRGIGYHMSLAGATLQSGTVMLCIVIIGLWGVLVSEGVRRIENRFEVWKPRGSQ